MGGDGMGGLSAAILLAMLAMLAAGFLIFYLVGRKVFRGSRPVALLLGLAGLGAGYLAVTATFFENSWSPPPLIRIETPAGYNHPNVILLVDRSAPDSLVWRGSTLPFSGQSATLQVPLGGVVRLNDIGPLAGRVDATVEWSDGSASAGIGGGPAPTGLNAESYTIIVRTPDGAEPPYANETAMAAYIQAREAQD